MPLEKRPENPLPPGPRPGSRIPPHKVTDNETLDNVARKYGLPVRQLIMHNFGTTNEREINWYLREHVGCNLPTHDHKNWRFSSTARPGLIYIPRQVLQMDPIQVVGGAPAPVDLSSGVPEFLASDKFTYEFKIPPGAPADLGYFLVQVKISVEGEMKQQHGVLKLSLKKDQVKAAIEKKLTEDTKATFAMKFDEKSLKPIADAVAKGSKEEFLKALFSPFEATIKTTYRWGNLSVVPEAGLEVSKTPLIIRVSGEWEGPLFLEGAPFKGKFALKAGFNVGLSAKGWAWVADKVGRPLLRQFLLQGGRALATVGEWLAAEGVFAAGVVVVGTVAGTLALASLCAWLVEDAKRKGELRGLATWYVSAYWAKVFREERPSGTILGDYRLRDQLILLGEKDALLDARATLKKANHAAANGSDSQVLEAFRQMLLAENNGSEYNAKIKLRLAIEEKSKRLAGL